MTASTNRFLIPFSHFGDFWNYVQLKCGRLRKMRSEILTTKTTTTSSTDFPYKAEKANSSPSTTTTAKEGIRTSFEPPACSVKVSSSSPPSSPGGSLSIGTLSTGASSSSYSSTTQASPTPYSIIPSPTLRWDPTATTMATERGFGSRGQLSMQFVIPVSLSRRRWRENLPWVLLHSTAADPWTFVGRHPSRLAAMDPLRRFHHNEIFLEIVIVILVQSG